MQYPGIGLILYVLVEFSPPLSAPFVVTILAFGSVDIFYLAISFLSILL